MRRSTWALFWILVLVLIVIPIVWMGDFGKDPSLEPVLHLAGKIRHSYRCGAITIQETGPKDALRLSISYEVGENPTLPDPAREMKQIADLAFMVYTASPIVGVDVERKAPRGTGGCERTFDVQTASFEKKGKPK